MKILLTFCFLILITSTTWADVYSWEDKDGMHFVDDLGKVPKKYRKQTTPESKSNENIKNENKYGYYETKLRIAQNTAKIDTLKCTDRYGNAQERTSCYELVKDRYIQEIRDIPFEIRKASNFDWSIK